MHPFLASAKRNKFGSALDSLFFCINTKVVHYFLRSNTILTGGNTPITGFAAQGQPASVLRFGTRAGCFYGHSFAIAKNKTIQHIIHFHAGFLASAKLEQVRLCSRLIENIDIQNLCFNLRNLTQQKRPFEKDLGSGKRDSNSRPQPWQGCALPTELFPQNAATGNAYSRFGIANISRKNQTAK